MPQHRDKKSILEQPPVAAEAETDLVEMASSSELHRLLQRPRAHEQIATAIVDTLSSDGIARVIVSGETQWCEATSLLRFPSRAAASDALLGRTVLVLLSAQAKPVILGVVAERLWDGRDAVSVSEEQVKLPPGEPLKVQLDKRRIDLEASEEIRLTCGKSSLVMRRDGTVIVRGVTIISRATQSNKIRGATVSVN